jgi:hypothetical protein
MKDPRTRRDAKRLCNRRRQSAATIGQRRTKCLKFQKVSGRNQRWNAIRSACDRRYLGLSGEAHAAQIIDAVRAGGRAVDILVLNSGGPPTGAAAAARIEANTCSKSGYAFDAAESYGLGV